MEEKNLKCPNCGANATNHQNCEYCGSLLVRFVDKGINLSNTSYTSNAEVFPGLIQHLQQYLKIQENTNESGTDDRIYFDIFREIGRERNKVGGYMCSIIGEDNQGLFVGFIFENFLSWVVNKEEFNRENNEQLARFEKLDCFPLFTPNTSYYEDQFGKKRVSHEYRICFGKDIEGAARITSEILQKVFQIPLSEKIEIITTQSDEERTKAYNIAMEARGYNKKTADWNIWRILGLILSLFLILSGVSGMMSQCS